MLVTCDDGSQQTVTVPKVVRDNPSQWTKGFDNGKFAWFKNDSRDAKNVPQTWIYPDGTVQEGTAAPAKEEPARQQAKAGAPGQVGPSGQTGTPAFQWDVPSVTSIFTAQASPAPKQSVTYVYDTVPTLKVAANVAQAARAKLMGRTAAPAVTEPEKRTEANIKLFTGIVLGVVALGLIVWVIRGK